MKHSVSRIILGVFLLSQALILAVSAQETTPSLDTLKKEFSHQLPSMWTLKELTVAEAFTVEGSDPTIWKAKLSALIETTDDTYLPTEYSLGTITVVRPVHNAGIQRKLFARAAARQNSDTGWEVAFQFDNDVTLSAGLPLDYFFGEVVVENSEGFKTLGEEKLTSHIDVVLAEHAARLAVLRKTHTAEVQALKDELNTLDDVEILENSIKQRIETLQKTVKKLHKRLEKTTTQLHTDGIVIDQWVSKVRDPFADLEDDKESRIKRRDWERSRPKEMLGEPDNFRPCEKPSPIDNAWSPNHASSLKWIEKVHVKFAEAVIPTELTIYESGNNGFVRQLTFHGEDPVNSKTINVQDVLDECPGPSVFPIVGVDFTSRSVTIKIDPEHPNDHRRIFKEAIDAVKLTGVIKPQENE